MFVKRSFILPAVLCLLAGCVKEAPFSERPMVTISASVPDDAGTKVGFDEASSNGLSPYWEDDDCIRVISGSQSERYDILEGYSIREARFRGPEVNGDKYTIILPGTCESLADAIDYDFTGIVQDGNNNLDHLPYIAILQDVDTKEDISFSSSWASAHGGSFTRSGVVKFILTLPSAAKAPAKVELSGPGLLVSIALKNANTGSSRVLTAYAPISCQDIDIPSGTSLKFTVTDVEGGTWVRTQTMSKATSLKAGVQSVFRLTKGFQEALFAGGDGTENNPYLIATAKHMYNMHAGGVLEQGKKTWFKMIDDVDMSAISDEWIPLNYDNPYGCEVDFDGDGHTINNFHCTTAQDSGCGAGFFRVMYGTVHDVNFTNASIANAADNGCGILGSYGGYEGKPSVVYNVHVQGEVVSTCNKDKVANGVGGMFGRISTIDIESCSADCEVVGKKTFVGGLFGYASGPSIIRNCWTAGSVTAAQRVGGIAGGFLKVEVSIINCYSLSAIAGDFCLGGIAGHCNLDEKSSVSPSTTYPDYKIEKCIAWNTSIKANTQTSGDKNHYSSGAIAAYIATHCYLTDCRRKANLVFYEYSDLFDLYDQANATPSNPLVIWEVDGAPYNFPYHGKAATAGKSLSQVARDLGWDQTIWNFSGDVPSLTGLAEFETHEDVQSGDSNAPHGTNPKPGQGEIRPSGTGWSSKSIASGVTYYTFAGTESVTNAKQEIFVIDLDLNNPNYQVKFVRQTGTTAQAFDLFGDKAIAAINGAYELGSIVMKADGVGYSYMPNNVITANSGATTPNWKSEAAVYCDGERNVKIRFDGYGLSIKEQRHFYLYNTSEWPNIISSAPMLVYDYNPVGEVFVDPSLTSDQIKALGNQCTENPNYHQGIRHPRTAIALTEGGHLLLIAVDGRHSGYSSGMRAKELTKFLVNNFNPQYALNLDGGGSTTMCVTGTGLGDDNTHVVNYPSDSSNSGHNHLGLRSVNSHICIVKK